jgi:hypothetical protein
MGFGMVIGFSKHLQNITTNNYNNLTELHTRQDHCNHSTHKVFPVCYIFISHCLVTDPNVICFHAHISTSRRMSYNLTHCPNCRLSVGQPVQLLLAFASTVIPGFSLLEIHDQDFYSLLNMYVFQNGASYSTKEASGFLCRHYVRCSIVSAQVHELSS